MPPQPSDPPVRLAEIIATLSLAIDLGRGLPLQSMLASCVLAVRLGDACGLTEAQLNEVYYLALLRWIGCTSDASPAAAAFGDEIAAATWLAPVDPARPKQILITLIQHIGAGRPPIARAQVLAQALAAMPQLLQEVTGHCEVGARLAAQLGLPPPVQAALTQVHERWDGRGMPAGLRGEAIALPLRVVLLAQDAALFCDIGGVAAATAMARARAGGLHDPAIVERFCQHAVRLLARPEPAAVWPTFLGLEPGPPRQLSGMALDPALRAMADFVDLKSPYLGGHSSGVADLAAAAARQGGLPAADTVTIWRAGLLHDLGRVGVSSALWDKPGALNDDEWERVRLHPYYTERILSRSVFFAPLAALAALHHERLDGSGYHRTLPGTLLNPAARLLAAADAYHAMTEPRPHRPALSAAAAAAELRREVEVLRLVARGLSNRQMAERLTISKKPSTTISGISTRRSGSRHGPGQRYSRYSTISCVTRWTHLPGPAKCPPDLLPTSRLIHPPKIA